MEAAEEFNAEVLDLRVLVPLDTASIETSVRKTGRVVLVECPEALLPTLQKTFLYLESPPVLVSAQKQAIATAIHQSLNY